MHKLRQLREKKAKQELCIEIGVIMEIEVLESKKEFLEFKLKGERHTFPQLLKYYLLKDPKVEFASYKLSHPHDKDSLFVLKTKGKAPKKALLDANKKISNEASEFKKCLKALEK